MATRSTLSTDSVIFRRMRAVFRCGKHPENGIWNNGAIYRIRPRDVLDRRIQVVNLVSPEGGAERRRSRGKNLIARSGTPSLRHLVSLRRDGFANRPQRYALVEDLCDYPSLRVVLRTTPAWKSAESKQPKKNRAPHPLSVCRPLGRRTALSVRSRDWSGGSLHRAGLVCSQNG